MPDINLLIYSIKYIYEKGNETKEKKNISFQDFLILIIFYSRIFLLVFIVIILILINEKLLLKLLVMLYSFIFIIPSFILDFPFFLGKKEPVDILLNLESESESEKNQEPKHPYMVSTIRFICCLIFLLISSLLLISFFFYKRKI